MFFLKIDRVKKSFNLFPFQWISGFILFIYFSPILFFSKQSKFLIHDNLNSNVVWHNNLANSGKMFSSGDEILDFTMCGIPRNCLLSEWSVDRLLYLFFNPQLAYSLNYFFIHIIAYLGFYFLLKRYLTNFSLIYNGVSLVFALLPFWPSGGITVAGIPLLVFCLLNIFYQKSTKLDWIIIFLFPFYSSFSFGNAFSFPLIFLFFIAGIFIKKWNFRWSSFLPFLIIVISTLLVESRLFYLILKGFKSNRIADVPDLNLFMNFNGILGSSLYAFLFGHYHFHTFNSLISIVTIGFIFYNLLKYKRLSNSLTILIMILSLVGFLSFFTILMENYNLKALFGISFPRISLRFWTVFPFLWYFCFSILLKELYKLNRPISLFILISQLLIVFLLLYPKDYFGSRYAENIFANTFVHSTNQEQQVWDDYFRVKELNNLKNKFPAIKSCYLATVDFNPEILQYNGLKTIEGYYSFYPLSKLLLIKQIDKPERIKTTINHFSHTNRNYLFIREDNFSEPDWDYNKLMALDVKFLISSRKFISNKHLECVYEGNILIYRLKNST